MKLLFLVAGFVLVPGVAAFAAPQQSRRAANYKTSSSLSATVEADVNPRNVGLALLLDDGTRKSHSVAQNSAFVSGFFKGLSTREAYGALLTSLYFVYQAMEDSFDATQEQRVKVLDNAELRRMASLEKDMDYFYGADWRSLISPSPATKAYVERVQQVASNTPYLLVAHQYTRYLGDLFGGQMMSGMATRSLELEDKKGVDFYQFEEITSVKDFITSWYLKLNALDLTHEQKQEIVDEANLVFDLNIGILEELEGSPFKAMWTLAINTIKVKLGITK
jgi:heme oxygenase